MASPLYCLPTDFKVATWTAPAGTINSLFPLANQNSVYSDVVTKFTGNTGTLRGTIASTAIKAMAFVNLGQALAGSTITLTNGGAMASQSLVVPAAPADAVSLNAWKDLRLVTAAAVAWDSAFSGSAPVAVGKVLLISNLRELPMLWRAKYPEDKPTTVFRSHYLVARGTRKNVRLRGLVMQFIKETFRAEYTTLRRSSEGPGQPFIIIPDPSVNDFLYCWFPNPRWEHERTDGRKVTTWSDTVEEQNPGLTL